MVASRASATGSGTRKPFVVWRASATGRGTRKPFVVWRGSATEVMICILIDISSLPLTVR